MNPLNYLYEAVAWLIMRIHTGWALILNPASGLAWVLTIVVLVILMRLILVPLFIKQMHATRKMSALAPQLQELRKKYKNDKQTLNEETMRLYRENGVNPLGGCLPLLGQMPMFFALFTVLRAISVWHPGLPLPYGMTHAVIISAQHADIFGATISDKFLFSPSTPWHAKIVILFAVMISVATTYMTVRQSTKRGMTPQMTPSDSPLAQSQKYMTYIVPLFALSGLYWQFGLVLYWVTTNIWTLGQQHVLFKRYPMTPGAAGAAATAAPASGGAKPPSVATTQRKAVRGGDGKSVTGQPKAAAGPAGGQSKPAAAQSKPSAGQAKAPGGPSKAAPPSQPAKRPAPGAKQPGAKQPAAGGQAGSTAGGRGAKADGSAPAANGTGILRWRSKSRHEAGEEPAAPEVKLVRQQRVRQSRSKRSGKR